MPRLLSVRFEQILAQGRLHIRHYLRTGDSIPWEPSNGSNTRQAYLVFQMQVVSLVGHELVQGAFHDRGLFQHAQLAVAQHGGHFAL
jgi:hypothetical protein